MLKAFNGNTFKTHGIIRAFLVELGGKRSFVEVEVVDAPLDYNLFLGRSWSYVMKTVVSKIFLCYFFRFEGNVITID